MADGWRCPECGLILAPSVAQHRCDPPSAEVTTVTPYEPPSGSGTISITEPNISITGTTYSGTVVSMATLADAVQRNLVRRAAADWRRRAV